MQNHKQKKEVKKSEKQRFYGQNKQTNKHLLSTLPFCPWAILATKNSSRAHTESELDVLGVHGKLVKYVVHSSKRKNIRKIIFILTRCPNSNRLVFGLKEF
jgi:hypothetical protein